MGLAEPVLVAEGQESQSLEQEQTTGSSAASKPLAEQTHALCRVRKRREKWSRRRERGAVALSPCSAGRSAATALVTRLPALAERTDSALFEAVKTIWTTLQ